MATGTGLIVRSQDTGMQITVSKVKNRPHGSGSFAPAMLQPSLTRERVCSGPEDRPLLLIGVVELGSLYR
jgi:hypothetical protein